MTLACPRCASPISDRVKLALHASALHGLSVAEAVFLIHEAAEALQPKRGSVAMRAHWADSAGSHRSAVYLAKQRAASLRAWQRPEARARMLAALNRRWSKPESKERMRASLKALWATPEGWTRMMGRRRHNGAAPTGREA